MTIGSGIAYAAFWFGLFGTICWVLWLAYLEGVPHMHWARKMMEEVEKE